ncbi:FAD-dependent oxidoreductase [Saccharopolyspora spinosporotrichia]
MKQHDTVLVVGAGPCGLAVAAELRRLGVQVTIVDSEPVAGTGSRAILLWPPVLEVLDELGVGATARETGLQPQALSYHLGTGRTVRVGLGAENAPLLLPQERTSALLEQALVRYGGAVERGIRITKVVQHDDSVAASALHPDGTTTDFEADWLIAADGLRSQVREQLGVPFEGEQLPTTFLLAEGRLEGDIGRDSIHYFLGETGVVLVAPLPGGEFRISGAIPEGTQVSTAQVQRLLDERGPGGLRVGELRALSTFVSHERAAGTLHTGRAFLLGDAAHVHSAIGGQGLNLGIQDARNLAWKLAGVVHGRFAPVVLRSYEAERRVAIRQTLATTGRMARQAVAGPWPGGSATWCGAAWKRSGRWTAGGRRCSRAGAAATRTCCSARNATPTGRRPGGCHRGRAPATRTCSPNPTTASPDASSSSPGAVRTASSPVAAGNWPATCPAW